MGKKLGGLGLVLCCLMAILSGCDPSAEIEVGCRVEDLIQAIDTANSDLNPNTLILEEGCLYNLTEANSTIDYQEEFTGESGSTGLPPISTPITIEGNQATIQRLDSSPEMRFFFVTSTGELTLQNLTMDNGRVQSGQINQRNGGAIYNRGVLNLVQSHMLDNYAEDLGGGIINAEGAVVSITDSSISYNQAGRHGGAIANLGTLNIDGYSLLNNNQAVLGSGGAILNLSTLSISGGHINGNLAALRGGGISSNNGSFNSFEGVLFEENAIAGMGGGALNLTDSSFMITDCTFYLNQTIASGASGGALLLSESNGTVNGETVFNENSSNADGGAVYIMGSSEVLFDMVTFQSNSADLRGGALSNYSTGSLVTVRNSNFFENNALSGGGISNSGQISVRKSLISDNFSMEGGAGILNSGPLFRLINSTISGNHNMNIGGGILNYGSLQISYTTIAFNRSMHGGGLYDNGNEVQVKNTIIASNPPYNCSVFGSLTAFGDNLDDDGSCQSFNITANPFLEPLASNGGPTQTHAFLFTNPAVDGVSDCTDFTGNSAMNLDQRSFLRPFNNRCDLGSYEAMGTPPGFQSIIDIDYDQVECREGPSENFNSMDSYQFGDVLTARGRNTEGSWVAVYHSDAITGEVLCWIPTGSVNSKMPVASFPILLSPDSQPEPVSEASRCSMFTPEAYTLTMLNIPYGTGDLTLYVNMPEGVPGLELDILGDLHPWIYSGVLGQYEDEQCTYEGYAGRLYCQFELPEDYFGTVRELEIYVNRCEEPIYTHEMVTIGEPLEPLVCSVGLSEPECESSGGTFSCGGTAECVCTCP